MTVRAHARRPDDLVPAHRPPLGADGDGARGEIRFGIGATTLGAILVAATGKGVRAILIGDEADDLVRDLKHRLPRADIIGGDLSLKSEMDLRTMVAEVVALVERPERGLDLPLDIVGTAFQHSVWAALRAIPPGATATYGDVARAIGRPAAVRAVASACGSNPIAVAIPCHRVVRGDGSLSGYRWGIARKQALLAREKGL